MAISVIALGASAAPAASADQGAKVREGSVGGSFAVDESRSAPPARAAASGDCQYSKTRKGFSQIGTRRQYGDNPAWYIRYKYFIYKQDRARTRRGKGGRRVRTKQLEMCSSGGAKGKDGNRIDRVVSYMTLRTRKDRLIGQKWATGEDKSSAGARLTFATPGPVSIGASIPIGDNGKLTGGQGPDKDTPKRMKPFQVNQVYGLWEGGLGVIINAGSSGFQGNVSHALWELPKTARTPRFDVKGRPAVPLRPAVWCLRRSVSPARVAALAAAVSLAGGLSGCLGS